MTVAQIRNGLQTEIIGQDILSYDEVPSTNDLALQRGAEGAVEGTLILAAHQTAGRGRRGRKWYAPPGSSILASLILRHRLLATQTGLPNLVGAVSIATAIQNTTNLPAMVKWPNDVLINGKKVGGVLTELAYDRHRQPFFVTGFGVNVNTTRADLPIELCNTATSLRIENGHQIPRTGLIQEILHQFEHKYYLLKAAKTASLIERANELLTMKGEWVHIGTTDGGFDGIAEAVDFDGRLILRDTTGKVRKIWA